MRTFFICLMSRLFYKSFGRLAVVVSVFRFRHAYLYKDCWCREWIWISIEPSNTNEDVDLQPGRRSERWWNCIVTFDSSYCAKWIACGGYGVGRCYPSQSTRQAATPAARPSRQLRNPTDVWLLRSGWRKSCHRRSFVVKPTEDGGRKVGK